MTFQSGAEIIVTSNVKDFPASALAPLGIEARSPDMFLGQLYGVAPTTVVRVLREQSAALVAPPMTVDEVLSALAVQAPQLVAVLRAGGR